jgi:hypothetical protein
MTTLYRLSLAIVFALVPLSSTAQSPTATLRGGVHDAQGGGIPAAVVTITVRETTQTRRVVAGPDGTFVAPNLPPGAIDVSVSAPGFREVRRAGVILEVGQTASLEIELPVVGVQLEVNVSTITIQPVDVIGSVVDTVIPAKLIEVLPLNGRNFLELALLVPGNAPAPNFDPTKSNTVAISSAGQLGRGGNVTIDGADNNDDVVGGPLQNITQESVQEFQIATNRFTAETGRSASSAINVVTKVGTDQLRGSASVFARDRRWQSLPSTYDKSAGDKPPFDRQQVAGAARSFQARRSGSARPSTATRTAPRS